MPTCKLLSERWMMRELRQVSVSETLIISRLALLRSLSRSCGGGLGWGKAAYSGI